jgi:arsenate reductase
MRRNDDCGSSFRNRDNRWLRVAAAKLNALGYVFESMRKAGPMKATIYHNPICGTSRKTLDILCDSGADVSVREYLKNPPSRAELKALYERAGITPRQGLRAKEPLAEELGLIRADVTEDEVLDAMVQHPILIDRPLVETPNGVRLCRPQELVREIL